MRKISPLGKRSGPGTFDSFYDDQKYRTPEEALENEDMVVVDFVADEKEIIHFEAYHVKYPEDRRHARLEIQHFPYGIDIADDTKACNLVNEIFDYYGQSSNRTD